MANYLEIPILDATEPDRAGGSVDGSFRRLLEANTQTGTRVVDSPTPADALVRQFEWVCFTRAEATVRRQFITDRMGRATPFWLCTWERDFALSANYAVNDPTLVVLESRYTLTVFAAGRYRRHLQIRGNSGTFYQRRVTAAVDNGNGTESLTIAPIAEAITAPGLISFLRYSRIDSDEITIDWGSGVYSRCVLPVRELPREVPA